MIEKIITYSVKNKIVILASVIGLIIWGLFSLNKLSIDAVPDITNNQVQILTTTRNLSTLDVEQFISYPIEMEMANLPGVKEIRSTNKFGLSVVTIVFNDNMGTYLPRQLIAEKIKIAKEKIPEGFGNPEMGPISTGLGEIYQYVIDVKPGYEDKYTDMDLRTIQDWMVKRQLSGIDGVVEINTWGGHLKQYEISIDPSRLKSMNITIDEIVLAMENNNSITGGGYVEKNNQSYFIRAEGLIHKLEDIEKVVVKNVNGSPILIGDIATVQYGHAPRFGAITGNGKGEQVLGQVMLLKGANTKKVLEAVINRVKEIQPTLPEGVFINPFLERSALLGKTTFTIAENLILGALIVIFVVILLLGNFRSGLIIASLIPLSLLFALGMMNVFGVSANLMSLGAIDFGIIIDGAIIIVEYILFSITQRSEILKSLTGKAYADKKDEIAIHNSSYMMRSAIFGQVIILIVFLPILTLQGVEGKMFRPMGMTFSFALIGAMILCLTYVPMMAALFIKPAKKEKNLADKFIAYLQGLYGSVLSVVMRFKKITLSIAVALLVIAGYIFSNMGGEFVPTLDEGDIVIQPLIASGTSLGKTIELCTRMETIIKNKFPEVLQVVSRIGAAEVPTDPMSMEEVDMIITLLPKPEWTTATTKDDLIEAIEEELNQLPGMEYEFTQPIEMRFNELISGSRADISVKIYGEDLDVLYNKAVQAKSLIDKISGAADVVVDKVDNMPQLKIVPDRSKIAQYGLNIKEINHTIQMAFAGMKLGEVYKGEQRYDIVMRYDKAHRSDIDDVEKTLIDLPNGSQVPLSEVADISIIQAPSKISRDDAKRRVSVGVNVRNRDLESVIKDIRSSLRNDLNLPAGYHIKYGGQFENLERARNRLILVVPMALILIFLLLYMTFHSVAEAALIYTAIPFAAIGGILLLWFRDMPFSISAGIGFIALFGIAVLNGIVLIEHYKHQKISDFKNIQDMIIEGTKKRIRPVLLTASAAALGFLPMAISTSSGAEVQRPLATAVIGGLITSTLLTLIILPLLYTWLLEWRAKRNKIIPSKMLLLLPFLLCSALLNSQSTLSLEDIIQKSITNSPSINARILQFEKDEKLTEMKYQPGLTSFEYSGDALISNNPNQVHELHIGQTFEHPKLQKVKNKWRQSIAKMSSLGIEEQKYKVISEVEKAYYQYQYELSIIEAYDLLIQDYQIYVDIADKHKKAGLSNGLDLLGLESELSNIETERTLSQFNATTYMNRLQLLTGETNPFVPTENLLISSENNIAMDSNIFLQSAEQSIDIHKNVLEMGKTNQLPEFNIGYGLQNYNEGGWYSAIQLGIDIPLFRANNKITTQANQIAVDIANQELNVRIRALNHKKLVVKNSITSSKSIMESISKIIQIKIPEMKRLANLNYKAGTISYLEIVNLLQVSKSNAENYWKQLLNHNMAVAEWRYLNSATKQ